MVTIFMNSGNIKTSDPQRLLLNLSDKKTQRERMNMLLYQTLVFTIHGKILKSQTNNKFKISASTWNEESE